MLLIAHVLSAIVGYGALGMTGAYARAIRHSTSPFASSSYRRFFRPGRNVAARVVLVVPILGAALVVAGGTATSSAVYPWIGLVLWFASAAVAYYVIWPAESAIQGLIAAGEDRPALESASVRLELGAAMTSFLFLAALIVMIGQP